MRVFSIASEAILESDQLPQFLPANGFVWVALARREFELMQSEVQQMLQSLCGSQLVDLHIADMLNNQLPSCHDGAQYFYCTSRCGMSWSASLREDDEFFLA